VASNRKKDAFGDSGSLRLLLTGYGLGLAVAWPILTSNSLRCPLAMQELLS
jgi:hypothetical protein